MAVSGFEHHRRLCLDTAWSQVEIERQYVVSGGKQPRNELAFESCLWRLMVGSHAK